jgi:hypothetical protein
MKEIGTGATGDREGFARFKTNGLVMVGDNFD